MELSKRLRAVADLVTAGYQVADIGTDHAYIPIFLTETGKTDYAVARAFLLQEGFFFIEEDMVEEDGKYYPMMKVRPPKKSGKKDGIKSEMWNDVQLQYGKLLLEKRHPVLKRYLEREIRIRTDILKSIEKKDSQKIQVRKRQLEEELNIAEKGMEYYAL